MSGLLNMQFKNLFLSTHEHKQKREQIQEV